MLTNNIKSLRVTYNLTQDELAKLCQCTRQTINAIEKNKYSPSLILAFKIADVLKSEIGDVFFAMVNYSRYLGINPENALRKTNKKFIDRFGYVEEKITKTGRKLSDSTLNEMDKYWEESKNNH